MKLVLAAAFVAATFVGAPFASAATVMVTNDLAVDDVVSASATLKAGDTAQFKFTALENLFYNVIALAGTGARSGADLALVRFGFTSALGSSYTTITPISGGPTSTASGSLPGGMLMAGDSFTIFWGGAFQKPVSIGATVVTEAIPPSAVPLPASLLLLLGGLGAVTGVSRIRRRKASAA